MRFSNSSAPASLRASISRASGALQLLDLSALELGERQLDARAGLALGAVDLLRHRVLVLTEPLGQLVDRTAPVVRLHLQLLERPCERVAGARLELLAQPHRRGALLVDRRVRAPSDSAATRDSTSAIR